MRYLNLLVETVMNKVKEAKHLRIYPEPEETTIKRDHWTLFAEPAPHDSSMVSVTCELCDTFIDASLDDPMIGHELRADFCKALDELGMDYTRSERTCVNREGLTQIYVFGPKHYFG
jgi:hypothetical protein